MRTRHYPVTATAALCGLPMNTRGRAAEIRRAYHASLLNREGMCAVCRRRLELGHRAPRPTYAHGFDGDGNRLCWAFNARGEQVRVTIPGRD